MAAPFRTFKTWSGRSITDSLNIFGEKAAVSFGRQLYREATGILEASRGLVPRDTSALASSGYAAEPVREGTNIRVNLGYGGPAARINPKTGDSTDGYALFVHENLEAHHPIGTAKYLELPFNQARSGMGRRIAAGIKADMHGGQTEMGDPEV